MKTPKEFTEEYTNLTANGIKPSFLYPEEQVYKLMQAYVNYVKVNNVVLDDVNGMCCENPKHATEVNDMFESWTYCKNCDKDIV